MRKDLPPHNNQKEPNEPGAGAFLPLTTGAFLPLTRPPTSAAPKSTLLECPEVRHPFDVFVRSLNFGRVAGLKGLFGQRRVEAVFSGIAIWVAHQASIAPGASGASCLP